MLHSRCCNAKTFKLLRHLKLSRRCCLCLKRCKVWQGKVEDELDIEIAKVSKNIGRLFVVFIFLFLIFILLSFKGVLYYIRLPL